MTSPESNGSRSFGDNELKDSHALAPIADVLEKAPMPRIR